MDRITEERVHNAFVGGYLSDRINRVASPLIEPYRHESGLPRISQRLMIDGTWNDGYSVKRLQPRLAR